MRSWRFGEPVAEVALMRCPAAFAGRPETLGASMLFAAAVPGREVSGGQQRHRSLEEPPIATIVVVCAPGRLSPSVSA